MPLLAQGSTPWTPSVAEKTTALPAAASSRGRDEPAPGRRSETSTVPASVPSDIHSSRPCVPSSAEKNSRPPATVSQRGPEPPGPGWMSSTLRVPASVPSLAHSSLSGPAPAWKKKVEPRAAVSPSLSKAIDPSGPGTMSFKRKVPAAVPSLTQGSRPEVPSSAAKKSRPATAVARSISEGSAPGRMSFTRTVPAAVPSLFQSSWLRSPGPALATKKSLLADGGEAERARSRAPGRMSLTSAVPPAVPSVFHSSCPFGRRGAGEEDRAADPGQPGHVLRSARGKQGGRAGARAVGLPEGAGESEKRALLPSGVKP